VESPLEKIRLQVSGDRSQLSESLGQLSPASLAYLGDAVYELYIRTYYLLPPQRLGDYHAQVVAKVRAEQQALYLEQLQPYLTDQEKDILRRGRNGAATSKPRRLTAQIYQQASSLETLFGYLYLQDPSRLHQLLEKLEL
jgi:ribonuclease-3 family protein